MSGFLARANLPLITKSGQPAPVPDDQTFTPMLKQFYQLAKSVGIKLEIVFVSSDRSESDMLDYFRNEHGDWLALAYSDRAQAQWLSQTFGVRGIPSLKVLNYDGESCVPDGRMEVMRALQGGPSGMVNCLQSWKALSGASASVALATSKLSLEGQELILKLVNNVLNRPSETKFRTVKLHNKAITQAGLGTPEGEAVMTACGWQKIVGADPGYTVPAVNDGWLRASRGALGRAIAKSKAESSKDTAAPMVSVNSVPNAKVEVRAKILYEMQTQQIEIETTDITTLRAVISSLFDIRDENSIRMFSSDLRKEGGELQQADMTGLALAGGKEVEIVVLTSLSPSNPSPTKLAANDAEADAWAQGVRTALTALVQSKVGGEAFKNTVRQQMVNNGMHVQLYEVPSNQEQALSVIPVVELHRKAVERCKRLVGEGEDGSPYYPECLLKEVVIWFKKSFFKWMDKPECAACGCKNTESQGVTTPTAEEQKGMAGQVEIYRCTVCGSLTRYPRFNHPVALLHTRSGRCGEWANCFCLVARSLGFEVRHVIDATDHVWSEIWVDRQKRWVHVDPCEAVIDAPLMYEQGWKKNLSWVWATSKDGCRDVTSRYTRQLATEAFQKRRREYAGDSEGMGKLHLKFILYSNHLKKLVDLAQSKNLDNSKVLSVSQILSSSAILAVNDALQNTYFARLQQVAPSAVAASRKFYHDRSAREDATIGSDEDESSATGVNPFKDSKTAVSSGRQTGSVEWRRERGELGHENPGDLECHGPTHDDTEVISLRPKAGEHMSEVRILGDDIAVYGMEVMWCSGDSCRRDTAISSSPHGEAKAHAMTIDDGDYITEVTGRSGSWIDYLSIRTFNGREVSAGGNGGAEFSLVKRGDGKRVTGFKVGCGGHLHNIGVYTAPVDKKPGEGRAVGAKELMQELFSQYVKEGMDQNAAAAKALLEAKRRLTGQ
ncbi:Peptide-N(4)-(N-acetyl-beta- glucosaminyl)asparagine amidase [Perkinsus chesapeaki]|uniref:Peptide-N(4)-(N-acetyl-beta-glucosaminyl)asparagine amidase n=1 Tax=Perkinsus chesapeaki TaxID=330153 RepID=A0A7J6LEL1_PERCH|nr:Peptide-N(4)-(N-acetyl-beta- glucosaminyl)asparagine amidase [Perkinsus chesapeaki]